MDTNIYEGMEVGCKPSPAQFSQCFSSSSPRGYSSLPLANATDGVMGRRGYLPREQVQGKVTSTISQGRLVWHGGKLEVVRGVGRYVAMDAFPPSLFNGLDKMDAARVNKGLFRV
mmetsp:Transcript_54869/g.174386  ORF Transcript_54869/g.174386 Transcript_54869/m.174386 type:complete len:115 (-) Transcript_54869:1045-1389(-)